MMADYIQADSINLSKLKFRNYSDDEKAEFKKCNEGFEEKAEDVLKAMSEEPDLLRLPDVDFAQVLDMLYEANELKRAETWLSKKQAQINETRRHKLSEIKTVIDQMVKQARPISEVDPKVADIFADLFDFLSAPAKKAASTKKKKSANSLDSTDESEK